MHRATSCSSAPASSGFPENALLAFALGCDMVNVAREAMLVDRLHPGAALPHRPLPDRRRPRTTRGSCAASTRRCKSARARELPRARCARSCSQLAHACGVVHPALVTLDHLEILDERFGTRSAARGLRLRAGLGHSFGGPARRPHEVHAGVTLTVEQDKLSVRSAGGEAVMGVRRDSQLGVCDHRTTTLVEEGLPAEVLMRVADEEVDAWIVVGRRGRGGFIGMALGSVPHALSLHAQAPVVIVPARDAEAE